MLAAIAAGVGLIWSGGAAPETATTIRGEIVELYGSGLYRHDSLHDGPVHRGTDAVALLLWLPLLADATVRYRRGSVWKGSARPPCTMAATSLQAIRCLL